MKNPHLKRWRNATLAAATLTPLVAGLLAPTAAEARINVHCAGGASSHQGIGPSQDAGIRQVDPIVSHNEPTSMHEHQFFGSLYNFTAPHPESANYSDYLGTKTSCNILKDTASYWAPVLRYKGSNKIVPVKRFEAYYLSWNNKITDPSKQTRVIPRDLRMVAGNPMAQSRKDANLNQVSWSCSQFSSKGAASGFRSYSPEDANCAESVSLLPGEQRFLTAIVHFPTCWTGRFNNHNRTGNTADFVGTPGAEGNQVAYTVNGKCPPGYPIKLMMLRFTESWDYRGDGKDVYLSSGMGDAAGEGFTYHADFWNTWDQAFLQKALNQCINTTRPDSELHESTSKPGVCGIKLKG
mgnify:CR=1 FL=1